MSKSRNSSKASHKALLVHVNDGVTYYRHMMSVKYLARMGWNIAHPKYDFGKTEWDGLGAEFGHTPEALDELVRSVDLLITQRNDVPQYIAESQLTQAMYNLPWIYDNDDNVHAIKPTNIGFHSYNPASKNPKWAITAMESCFALTVSTENLKEVYSKTNKRIFVLPNGVDFEEWDTHPRGQKPEGEIRISLVLSGSHYEDIREIEDVLIEVIKRYPQVKVYVMDAFKGDTFVALPKKYSKQLVWTKWVSQDQWPKWNKEMAFDIGLAPLLDNDFNRAKSNLRWLEYAAQGVPTIGSDVEPYRTAENGKTIVLVKNSEADWYDALVDLVENPEKRQRIGKAAYDDVKARFSMDVLAPLYDKTYKQIIKEYREKYGDPQRTTNLSGPTTNSIYAAIDARADDIFEENTGRRPFRDAPSQRPPQRI